VRGLGYARLPDLLGSLEGDPKLNLEGGGSMSLKKVLNVVLRALRNVFEKAIDIYVEVENFGIIDPWWPIPIIVSLILLPFLISLLRGG